MNRDQKVRAWQILPFCFTKLHWYLFYLCITNLLHTLRKRLSKNLHCVKSVLIRSFSGPYFPTFGLNTEIHRVNLRFQFEYGKTRTRKLRIRALFTKRWWININVLHVQNRADCKGFLHTIDLDMLRYVLTCIYKA